MKTLFILLILIQTSWACVNHGCVPTAKDLTKFNNKYSVLTINYLNGNLKEKNKILKDIDHLIDNGKDLWSNDTISFYNMKITTLVRLYNVNKELGLGKEANTYKDKALTHINNLNKAYADGKKMKFDQINEIIAKFDKNYKKSTN
jgi:hypothetical protein